MGTALVAVINRAARAIELDPAVRVGARLDLMGEAVLLHTTSIGHCGETAAHLAHILRRSGWRVTVRAVESLGPAGPRLRPDAAIEVLAHVLGKEIGPAAGSPDCPPPLVAAAADAQSKGARRLTRWECRVCGHRTIGRGVHSHTRNVGHDDWQKIVINPDGTVSRAEDEEGPPESPEAPLSAAE